MVQRRARGHTPRILPYTIKTSLQGRYVRQVYQNGPPLFFEDTAMIQATVRREIQ